MTALLLQVILFKLGRRAVFIYGFAKSEGENIDADEDADVNEHEQEISK